MISNWRVYDAVTAHDPSRVYPANSGSCSDRTVSAAHQPSSDLTFWTGLSGIFPANLTVTRPHGRKTTVRRTAAFAEVTGNPVTPNSQIYMGKLVVAGVGFEPT